MKIGYEIESEDYEVMTFKGIEYTTDLLPSNTNGFYTHYEVNDSENTYLVVKYDIKNLQGSVKDAETFVGVKAVYMDKYTYSGFVVEEPDGTGFNSYDSIKPLSKASCYCLIEIPKSVADNQVNLEIALLRKNICLKG